MNATVGDRPPETGAVGNATGCTYDPDAPGFYQNPYPHYDRLRAFESVHWARQGVWIVTGHAEALSILRDRRFSTHTFDFGSATGETIPPELIEAAEAVLAGIPVFIDPPDHTRLRLLANRAFVPKTVEVLRPRIEAIVDSLLDAVQESGRFDVLTDFARPLSFTVLADILGVPEAGRPRYNALTEKMGQMSESEQTPESLMSVLLGLVEIRQAVGELIDARADQPDGGDDDLLGTMIAALGGPEDGREEYITREELVGFSLTLLTAGHDTTASLIGNAVCALLRHPEQLATLRQDPNLIPAATEELLRYDTSVPMAVAPRLATEDVEVGGQLIRKGQSVRILLAAANRDPAVFADANGLDLARGRPQHLSFASGIHSCIGANVARAEIQIGLTRLLGRFPGLTLADEPRWVERRFDRKLDSLFVSFPTSSVSTRRF